MAAYALEAGGKAAVTAVLRSNYAAVSQHGFEIDSIQHGSGIKGFRPTARMASTASSLDEPRAVLILNSSNENHT